MTSDEMGSVFQNEGFRFNPPPRGGGVIVPDPDPKTRELSVYTAGHHRFFRPQEAAEELRHTIYVDDRQQDWNVNGRMSGSTRRIVGSDDDDDEEEEEEDEEDCEGGEDVGRDGDVKAIDAAGERINQNNGSNTSSNTDNTIVNVGSNRDSFGKYDNLMLHGNGNDNSNSRGSNPNESNHHHLYLQGAEGSGSRKKLLTEDGCGLSGSRDYSEFLRRIFSDPLTGDIMNDGVILPCGHSYGGGGIQHVLRMKACYTCSRPISEEAVTPNLSLRAAVQAFLREEELQVHRPSKRRRGERFEKDRGVHPNDSLSMDQPRGRGVQFPFSVMDRVIIQGNKRTPQRFVGRKAIVTAQCLNGWYVVKTLDNAESVKLQYRSLAKAPDDQSSSLELVPNKMAPNWLFSSSKDSARYTN